MTSLRQCYKQLNHIKQKGIEVDFADPQEAAVHAAKLLYLINANTSSYVAYLDAESSTINIETTYCDPVLSVEFSKSGIHFIPLVDTTWYGAFFEVVRILYTWEEKKIEKEEKKSDDEEAADFDWI